MPYDFTYFSLQADSSSYKESIQGKVPATVAGVGSKLPTAPLSVGSGRSHRCCWSDWLLTASVHFPQELRVDVQRASVSGRGILVVSYYQAGFLSAWELVRVEEKAEMEQDM